MLSGLLITLDILVCIALTAIVLLQRSEGGAFGMGGGPTGLITTRGAGDLLTRTTLVLFSLFLVLSVGLTLLGAHDKATSNVLSKLKLQQANPSALSQPIAPPPTAPVGAPLTAPAPEAPLSAPAPQAAPPATAPAAASPRATRQRSAPQAQPAAPTLEAPAPKQPTAPTLEAPAPQPVPAAPQP